MHLFENQRFIEDRLYSIETGWVYLLDNGWYVQEWMGVLSAWNLIEPYVGLDSVSAGSRVVFNYSHEDDKPSVYYNVDQVYDYI